MVTANLIKDLEPHLRAASEIWIAVALLKDNAFNKIQEYTNKAAVQHWLVGIDLPTTPSVLNLLKSKESASFKALIYNKPETFHPKVYLIKKADGYIAFVGSANATEGGFSKNVELSFEITEQKDCLEILDWFNNVNSLGESITDEFILSYELTYKKNQFLASIKKSNSDNLKGLNKPIIVGAITISQEQFFRQSDFDAFAPINHQDASPEAKERRRLVRERFLELNELIFDRFKEFGIDDLHLPKSPRNYTSQYYHTPRSSPIKDALWLNYGKSLEELAKLNDSNFTRNVRIQVIIRNTEKEAYVGVWLFVAKQNGSYEDREYLNNQLGNEYFLSTLYEYIIDLGGGYWIDLNDDSLWISEIGCQQDLYDFLIEDDFESYFIIGRNYQPNDPDLSIDNIKETVLTEFSKLYKIYDLIKAK